MVEPLDDIGLLSGAAQAAVVDTEELDDDALLAELGIELDAPPITELKHVRSTAEKKAAEEVASRDRCEDFETFKPLFEQVLGEGWSLVRREHPTAIGPVDILARDEGRHHVAVEIKRRGEIDGVEQLTRYLELMNRDPHLRPVAGVFAAQEIKPQARVLAEDRGIRCVVLDYDALRGIDDVESRLF